jgi:hypothetical protein
MLNNNKKLNSKLRRFIKTKKKEEMRNEIFDCFYLIHDFYNL